MLLLEILKDVEYESLNFENIEISDIGIDSRNQLNNGIFVCIVGEKVDSHNFAMEAIKNGAKVLIVEKFLNIKANTIQIKVNNTRKSLVKMAENYYENPLKNIKLIGITGTNGKTTSSYIVKSMLEECGFRVGLIGTSAYYVDTQRIESGLTTPDTLDLYRLFKMMKEANCEYIIMEVSAHAVALYKIWGIEFDVGLFTNISQDHLDFFGNINNYANVKMSFLLSQCKKLVVNCDDEYGHRLYDNASVSKVSYAIKNPSDIFAINIKNSIQGINFVTNVTDSIFDVKFCLPGIYNVYNVLGCLGVGKILHLPFEKMIEGVKRVTSVEGRFDVIKIKDFHAIIDYAHSPDAIQKALETAIKIKRNKVIIVFGSPGFRDSGKRKEMGRIASTYADFCVITSDNPRYENMYNIAYEISLGVQNDRFLIETDREKAIQKAFEMAEKNDLILICGKGNENYMDIKGKKIPYNDYEVVKKFINSL